MNSRSFRNWISNRGRGLVVSATLGVLAGTAPATVSAQPPRTTQAIDAAKVARKILTVDATAVPKFSTVALETLVGGIALYPDPLIEQILDAAQNPGAIELAADPRRAATADLPESVVALQRYPEVLKRLATHLPNTTLLGIAAKHQLEDVWTAIESVRGKVDAAMAEGRNAESQPVPTQTGGTTPAAPYGVPWVAAARRVAAVAVAPLAVAELQSAYVAATGTAYPATQTAAAGTGATTTTVTGPEGQTATIQSAGGGVTYQNGTTSAAAGAGAKQVTGPNGNTVSGAGGAVAGKTTNGNTTQAGAAGAGVVVTPNGTKVAGAGAAGGQVTKTDTGATYNTQAAGGVATSNGTGGVGTREASGSVNKSGSGVTTSRNVETSLDTTAGSIDVSREKEKNLTGDGNGSASKTNSVTTGAGTATVETDITKDGITKTVTTPEGTKSETFADGEPKTNSTRSPQASSSRSQSTNNLKGMQSSSRYRQMNDQQIAAANQSLDAHWGGVQQQARQNNSQPSILKPNANHGSKNAPSTQRSHQPHQTAPSRPQNNVQKPQGKGGNKGGGKRR